MNGYRVTIRDSASKSIRKLSRDVQGRVTVATEALAANQGLPRVCSSPATAICIEFESAIGESCITSTTRGDWLTCESWHIDGKCTAICSLTRGALAWVIPLREAHLRGRMLRLTHRLDLCGGEQ